MSSIKKYEEFANQFLKVAGTSLSYYMPSTVSKLTEIAKTHIDERDELVDALDLIVKEAIKHWPDAENWECIQNAQVLVEKVRRKL